MLVFVEEEKPENPEKKRRSKARTNNKLNPHETEYGNRTRVTEVGDSYVRIVSLHIKAYVSASQYLRFFSTVS